MLKNKAFSTVELLIAIIIISILLVALAPVMTKKSTAKQPVVKQTDGVPVGAMMYWYGTNYPKNWMPVKGQDITGDEYKSLREAMGGIEELPNFNLFQEESEDSLMLIIKAKK